MSCNINVDGVSFYDLQTCIIIPYILRFYLASRYSLANLLCPYDLPSGEEDVRETLPCSKFGSEISNRCFDRCVSPPAAVTDPNPAVSPT